MKKRKANYTEEELIAILNQNYNFCYDDKQSYADRYDKCFDYYAGIAPVDENNTGVDPIPVVREIVDENFQILQGLFNGSTSSSVLVTSANIKSTLAEAISSELNTVARNLNNISRKMENYIKETLLTGQSHMKIYMEDRIDDERVIEFEDRTEKALELLEKGLKARGFNDITVKVDTKKTKTKRTTQEEREAASKLGLPVVKSYKVYSGKITAISRVVFPAIDYIPFQEVFIHPQTQYSLDEAPYFCHRYMMTINDGLLNGWDEDVMMAGQDLNGDADSSFANTGLIIGNRFDPYTDTASGITINNSQNVFPVYEHYIKIAYRGSVPKLWKFTTTANSLLQDPEELEEIPFVSSRVHEIPNSFYGMGIYDTAKFLQDSATRENRMLTYSASKNTLGQYWALKEAYDPEALLTPRAGGVVEVDQINAVGVLPSADVSNALNLLMNQTNSRIQGQMKSAGSIGEQAEKYGEMAGVALSMLIDKQEQSPKSRAATFAETGLVPLYKKLYRLLQRIQHPLMNESGGYSLADFPKEIGLSFDVSTVTDKQQAAQNVITAINMAKELYGTLPKFITEENVYSALAHYVTAGTGNEDVSSYITDPATQKPNKLQIHMEALELNAKKEALEAQAEGYRLANGKLLSEIRKNDAQAANYTAQMVQTKEKDKHDAETFNLTVEQMKLENQSLAMDVITKREELSEMPTRLAMDAATLESQLTAEQVNIVNGEYVQGANT
jgi:hypothetical protein